MEKVSGEAQEGKQSAAGWPFHIFPENLLEKMYSRRFCISGIFCRKKAFHGTLHGGKCGKHMVFHRVSRACRGGGSCERVFSLLECMYGEDQLSSLADQLRAALMLAYNDRHVG